jgi:hypothetical protein
MPTALSTKIVTVSLVRERQPKVRSAEMHTAREVQDKSRLRKSESGARLGAAEARNQ